jgi:hypothetical protein
VALPRGAAAVAGLADRAAIAAGEAQRIMQAVEGHT